MKTSVRTLSTQAAALLELLKELPGTTLLWLSCKPVIQRLDDLQAMVDRASEAYVEKGFDPTLLRASLGNFTQVCTDLKRDTDEEMRQFHRQVTEMIWREVRDAWASGSNGLGTAFREPLPIHRPQDGSAKNLLGKKQRRDPQDAPDEDSLGKKQRRDPQDGPDQNG